MKIRLGEYSRAVVLNNKECDRCLCIGSDVECKDLTFIGCSYIFKSDLSVEDVDVKLGRFENPNGDIPEMVIMLDEKKQPQMILIDIRKHRIHDMICYDNTTYFGDDDNMLRILNIIWYMVRGFIPINIRYDDITRFFSNINISSDSNGSEIIICDNRLYKTIDPTREAIGYIKCYKNIGKGHAVLPYKKGMSLFTMPNRLLYLARNNDCIESLVSADFKEISQDEFIDEWSSDARKFIFLDKHYNDKWLAI